MNAINARLGEVTERLVRRSHDKRQRYLDKIRGRGEPRPKAGSPVLRQPRAWLRRLRH